MKIIGNGAANGAGSVQTTALNGKPSAIPPSAQGLPAAALKVSPRAELMGKLKQLQQQDPAQFREVTTQIAESLKSAAQQPGQPQASATARLAERFAKVAQTGDLSALEPSRPNPMESRSVMTSGQPDPLAASSGGGSGGGMGAVLKTVLNQVNAALGVGGEEAAESAAAKQREAQGAR